MKKYQVTFKAEVDLGVSEEVLQEAVRVIKTGEAVDPNTPVSKVEVKDGIIFCDFSMTVEASDEQDAIAQAKQYLDKQIADASEVTPWRIYGFKAKEVA